MPAEERKKMVGLARGKLLLAKYSLKELVERLTDTAKILDDIVDDATKSAEGLEAHFPDRAQELTEKYSALEDIDLSEAVDKEEIEGVLDEALSTLEDVA